MAVRAVVFDRDGVLTYFDVAAAAHYLEQTPPLTPYDLVRVWEAYGREQGFPTTLEQERTFFQGYWARLCTTFAVPADQQQFLYALDYTHFVRAFPEAPAALARLHSGGMRIGVLSNFALASLDASLQAAGLDAWIDASAAATTIGAAKPAAAAYHAVLARLGSVAHETLFCDDEPDFVAGAAQVGMHAFLVDRRRAASDFAAGVIASLADMPALVAWVNESLR